MINNAIGKAHDAFEHEPHKVKSVTVYLNDKLVVRLTRRHKFSKRNRRNEFVLTVGQPNYLEARLIKRSKKLAQSLPLTPQIRYNPVKRKKTK